MCVIHKLDFELDFEFLFLFIFCKDINKCQSKKYLPLAAFFFINRIHNDNKIDKRLPSFF